MLNLTTTSTKNSQIINKQQQESYTLHASSLLRIILRTSLLFGGLFVLAYQSSVVLSLPSTQQHTIQLVVHAVAAVGWIHCIGKGLYHEITDLKK